MKIDRSFWYINHVQWHRNHVKEKVKSTITANSLAAARADMKMDLQQDTNCSYWKENKNLMTACKPLSWNYVMLGFFQMWDFFPGVGSGYLG